MPYHELSVEERPFDIQTGLLRDMSQRTIARMLNRNSYTIYREIRRDRNTQGEYVTQHARQKLVHGNEFFLFRISDRLGR